MEDFIPRQSEASTKKKRGSMLRLWLLFGVCFTCGALLYFSVDPFAAAVAKRIPMQWEEDFAKSVFEKNLQDKSCRDPRAAAVLQRLSNQLTGTRDHKFKIAIMNDHNVNAFALPGGYIAFNKGFLRKSESPEEVAGVMAHEMQHALQRHVTKGLVRKAFLSLGAIFAFGDVSGVFLYEKLGQEAIGLSYQRGDELAADRAALKMLDRAKISRKGFADFFRRLQKKGASGDVPTMLSTHPGHKQRLKLVLDKMPRRGLKKPMSRRDWRYLNNVTCKHARKKSNVKPK